MHQRVVGAVEVERLGPEPLAQLDVERRAELEPAVAEQQLAVAVPGEQVGAHLGAAASRSSGGCGRRRSPSRAGMPRCRAAAVSSTDLGTHQFDDDGHDRAGPERGAVVGDVVGVVAECRRARRGTARTATSTGSVAPPAASSANAATAQSSLSMNHVGESHAGSTCMSRFLALLGVAGRTERSGPAARPREPRYHAPCSVALLPGRAGRRTVEAGDHGRDAGGDRLTSPLDTDRRRCASERTLPSVAGWRRSSPPVTSSPPASRFALAATIATLALRRGRRAARWCRRCRPLLGLLAIRSQRLWDPARSAIRSRRGWSA